MAQGKRLAGVRTELSEEILFLEGIVGCIAAERFSVVTFEGLDGFLAPASWLRLRLDNELAIHPPLCNPPHGITPNAREGQIPSGQPTKAFSGMRGDYALNILKERKLRHGTEITGGQSKPLKGIWNGPPTTAIKYAWPTKWPSSHAGLTLTMLELEVSARTTHSASSNVFCTQWEGCAHVVAILFGRWRGRAEPKRFGFINMHNGFEFDGADLDLLRAQSSPSAAAASGEQAGSAAAASAAKTPRLRRSSGIPASARSLLPLHSAAAAAPARSTLPLPPSPRARHLAASSCRSIQPQPQPAASSLRHLAATSKAAAAPAAAAAVPATAAAAGHAVHAGSRRPSISRDLAAQPVLPVPPVRPDTWRSSRGRSRTPPWERKKQPKPKTKQRQGPRERF